MSQNTLDAGQSPASPTPPTCPNPTSNLTDFTALASVLNEVAQALLKYEKLEEAPNPPITNLEEGHARGEFHDEVRSYRVPAYIVKEEHKLLSQHQEPDLLSLLDKGCEELFVIITLMCYADIEDESILDFSLMGEILSRSLSLLSSVRTCLADFKLLSKTMVTE